MKFLFGTYRLTFLVLVFAVVNTTAQEPQKVAEQKAELPFATRVDQFWNWWTKNAERIQKSAEEDGGQVMEEELTQQVLQLGPNFSWSFGPPPEGQEGYSFTLSPSGERGLFFLTSFWLSQAPELSGWHFYSSQPPNADLSTAEVQIDEETILTAEGVHLTMTPAAKGQEFDLVAWSPVFEGLSPQDSRYLVFLFLEAALGENGLARWVANVSLGDKEPKDGFPLTDLSKQISQAAQKKSWNDTAYETTQFQYTLKEPGRDFLRHDMAEISTLYGELSLDYLLQKGELENPIPGTGATLKFFRIPKVQLPKEGSEIDSLRFFQGVLEVGLSEKKAGKAIGGGLSEKWAYFDVILFNEEAGLKAIKDTLSRFEGEEVEMHSFY